MQGSSLSWLIGGEGEGEGSSVESLVSLAGGRLCGAILPPLPSSPGRAGLVGGAAGDRVFVCGGVAGSGELLPF